VWSTAGICPSFIVSTKKPHGRVGDIADGTEHAAADLIGHPFPKTWLALEVLIDDER
jgi:hypothetical protein